MFRIRKVVDDLIPINQEAIARAQEILRLQFSLLSNREIEKLPEQLRNPLKFRFQAVLFVADKIAGGVQGFALLLHAPDLKFCYLDYISIDPGASGRGYGSALYSRVREEALLLDSIGLFFESLPDDPALSRDLAIRKQNVRRLRFYEKYGARPITGTAYETPLTPGDDNPPYLLFDDLGRNRPLRRDEARGIVRAILERKYGKVVSKGYIDMVVDSFKDDPVMLRAPKYKKVEPSVNVMVNVHPLDRIALVVNDKHEIHHVKERGYVESPVRIRSLLREINKTDLFQNIVPQHFSEHYITDVHDTRMFNYFKKVCSNLPQGKSVYPYVFPIRNAARPPKELSVRAGYYCIDSFTPLNQNAFLAAKRAVDCAVTSTKKLLEGHHFAYAMVRPPGHHAETRAFGGFCYFNSAAISAHYLSKLGKVSILDVDYHHGNGTQEIFYERDDVLTISLHGHPNMTYPYFSGFEEEKGAGRGEGYNVNVPLPENMGGERYLGHLSAVVKRITRFSPRFLVLALGLDTAKGDPTGTWLLTPDDFEAMGRVIAELGFPTLIVQEGGYDTGVLGRNARRFFTGLFSSWIKRPGKV